MPTKIDTIEGIGPTYAAKLAGVSVNSVETLLERGATRNGRKVLVEATGLSEKLILKWVNMADLMRIKGVGEEYSELLEAAGVDTVKELRNRNAENLAIKMAEVNARKKLVRAVPSAKSVISWVEQAKTLPPAVTY